MQQTISKPLLSFCCICRCAKETTLSISPVGVSIGCSALLQELVYLLPAVLQTMYFICVPMCILVVQQNAFNCLHTLSDADLTASVTGYNGGVFDVSWDLVEQGACSGLAKCQM